MKLLLGKGVQIVKKIDWWLLGSVSFLLVFGLIMQYSIAVNQGADSISQFTKQLTIVSVGVAFFFFFTFFDHNWLRTHPLIYVGIAYMLLVAVLIFGQTIKGTTGWFVFGSFSLQPVEFVKLLLILFVSSYFATRPETAHIPKYILTVGILTAGIVGFVLLQPDLGSAFILFVMWFVYMLMLKSPKWFIASVVVLVTAASLVGWFFLFEQYQKDRLTTFIHPELDPLGSGYNITQSIIAVGSGGFWGKGIGLGTQSQLHFLPEVTSDFIFAAIAEEVGFIGVLALLTAYSIIFVRLWQYMKHTQEYFSLFFLLGVTCYLSMQSVLVIGMNIGVLPVTGVPLPLISAGGSSMVVTLIMLGIAHNIIFTIRNKQIR